MLTSVVPTVITGCFAAIADCITGCLCCGYVPSRALLLSPLESDQSSITIIGESSEGLQDDTKYDNDFLIPNDPEALESACFGTTPTYPFFREGSHDSFSFALCNTTV